MFTLRSFPVFYFISIICLAFFESGMALAIELPAPATLMTEYSLKGQNISVIEPHESKPDHPVIVDYQALALIDLLTKWFGDRWKMSDTEIVFFLLKMVTVLLSAGIN